MPKNLLCGFLVRVNPELPKKAVAVCGQLQDWLEKIYGDNELSPRASITLSRYYVSISVGDLCVWDTEDTGGKLSIVRCKAAYREHVKQLATFVNNYYSDQ